MDSIELELLDRIKSKVNDLIEENINLRNAFEEACKSNDDLYAKFLKIKFERDAAVNDIESLIHDDHMEVCDLCNLNQGDAFRCKATCAKAHWRGVNNK